MPPYYRAATKKYITGSSVTGPRVSIPLSVIPSPMSLFCPGSARGRHLMAFDKDRPANLVTRSCPCGTAERVTT
jgi:hypothetical protein